MGTLTANILVGQAHLNHGGINPDYQLFLRENDRPAWILTTCFSETQKKIIWIPTVKNMLEDALVMIAVFVIEDEGVIEKIGLSLISHDQFQLYDVSEPVRNELYKLAGEALARKNIKLVISVFAGSTIIDQINALGRYKIDMEICKTNSPVK